MSTAEDFDETTREIVRYHDVIENAGHAWVLAHDDKDWFYECLRCGDHVHVLTIEEMNKAVEHNYAYMAVNHRAPWRGSETVERFNPSGENALEKRPAYPPCPKADAVLPDMADFKRGPLTSL
ncbi:MAG: hypothetical protein HGA39_05860 [Coriobacteriia bacterium]|nr:hypothetical protein [Coriobacteriia bacterium]